jgi:hypothetical protein
MHELTCYRQKRQDGGVRTAIELDGETVFHRFEEGSEEHDPALLWYVDLRCEGEQLPGEAEAARDWLLNHVGPIKQAFQQVEEKVSAGVDRSTTPLSWSDFPPTPDGTRMTIVCATIRRLTALDLAQILRDVREGWEERIRSLPAAHAVSR